MEEEDTQGFPLPHLPLCYHVTLAISFLPCVQLTYPHLANASTSCALLPKPNRQTSPAGTSPEPHKRLSVQGPACAPNAATSALVPTARTATAPPGKLHLAATQPHSKPAPCKPSLQTGERFLRLLRLGNHSAWKLQVSNPSWKKGKFCSAL